MNMNFNNKKKVLMVQGLHEEGQKLLLARDDIEPITIMSANEDEILEAAKEVHGITVRTANISRKIIENSKDFGTRTRTAKCIEGKNRGQTCLELIGNSNKLKVMEATCAGVIDPCQIDHHYLNWTPWSDCPKCVNTAESNPKCKRTRRCMDGKHGGSECPSIVR